MLDRKTKTRSETKMRQLHKDAVQSKLIDKTKDCSIKSVYATKTK